MSDEAAPQPAQSSAPNPAVKRAVRAARYIFWIMFLINFLNYFDRAIFNGVTPAIKAALNLNDFEVGLASSAFLLVYSLVAIPLGFAADRFARKVVVAAGVAVWSVASFATGLASGVGSLLGIRAVLGIGEGSYYPSGTPLLGAHYPSAKRPQIFGRWAIGALAGGAVGFLAAGFFNHADAWRNAFFFTGIPGLVLAVLLLISREKARHEDDPVIETPADQRKPMFARIAGYWRIPTVRTIIGMQALGFITSSGALTFFIIYLTDNFKTGSSHFPHSGISDSLAPIIAGGIVLLGSVIGTLLGSPLARWLSRKHSGARVLAGGIGFLIGAPAVLVAVGAPYALYAIPGYSGIDESTRLVIGVALFCLGGLVAAACLNFYQGPTTAATLDVVPADERASVGGTVLGLSHLLGDVYAVPLIGLLADRLQAGLGGSQIGLAMLLTLPITLLASGIVGVRGSRHYAKDAAAAGNSAEALLGVSAMPAHL